MRPEIYRLNQAVRFADTDAAGIVYFGKYAIYFDETVLSALRQHSVSWDSNRTKGFIVPIVESKAEFYRPLRAGDQFQSLMSVVKLSNRSFKTEHMIIKEVDGHPTLIASGNITRVAVDAETFRPIKIKEQLKAALQSHQLTPEAWNEYFAKIKSVQR